jgi:hypothetical protein
LAVCRANDPDGADDYGADRCDVPATRSAQAHHALPLLQGVRCIEAAGGTLGSAQVVTDSHGHYVRTWVSRHVNGWEAWVCENEHGDFDAFACPAGAATVARDAVEDTEVHAKDAAFSLSSARLDIAVRRAAVVGC